MALLKFKRHDDSEYAPVNRQTAAFLKNYSLEVMPRTASKIDNFRTLLPSGTRVYIAHIEGTSIADMVVTARRLALDGFAVMPHFPARMIRDSRELEEWIKIYQSEAGVTQALLLAGSRAMPVGEFDNSMQMLETGLFDKAGFGCVHVAGHPEGNRDIDPGGGTAVIEDALQWKQKFSERTQADMAIVTQFIFNAEPVIEWANGLKRAGITLPIHIGVAGPAKLQTLIKFAVACGVGPSISVLQKRARDVSKLLLPFEPSDVVNRLAQHKADHPDSNIKQVHFFPLGGIEASARWAMKNGDFADQEPLSIA
ncbi:MAG: methylenetetrahydrofolate reductase [Aestuariivita sp.]|nr:methylenetetrahydrofolate reductase [Aestuariivita sp.]